MTPKPSVLPSSGKGGRRSIMAASFTGLERSAHGLLDRGYVGGASAPALVGEGGRGGGCAGGAGQAQGLDGVQGGLAVLADLGDQRMGDGLALGAGDHAAIGVDDLLHLVSLA